MSISIGHDDEFWNNFKFLLQIAVKNNLYTPIDYGKKSQEYCAVKLHLDIFELKNSFFSPANHNFSFYKEYSNLVILLHLVRMS